jgi:DNA-directed RNA polymerase specialized sigma24 family protein
MLRTFEEKVGEELDSLYRAALFLCARDRRCAEELLIHTMTHSVRAHAVEAGAEPFERWLEVRLVRQFLDHATNAPVAAQVFPAQPRAALWLVYLRGWSYDDAASALGVDGSTLKELLLYRDLLLQEIVGPGSGATAPLRAGADEMGCQDTRAGPPGKTAVGRCRGCGSPRAHRGLLGVCRILRSGSGSPRSL